jgi:Putative multidrug resistance efflux transporter
MEDRASLPKLVFIGVMASVFFSATFVLNYTMHLAGGHWLWSAIGRYAYMILILLAWVLVRDGTGGAKEIVRVFNAHFMFWIIAGSIGFGAFYAGICYAASYSRGWVVAATWQSTVLLSPFVLLAFGFKFPSRGLLISALIFAGVLIVNHKSIGAGFASDEILYGILPVLIAALAYPVGNQLLNAAKNGTLDYVPHIDSVAMHKSTHCVLLLSVGSVPFWALLYAIVRPPAPELDQYVSTFLVALSSGVIATGLFLHARNLTSIPYRIAAVDATLAAEVAVTLAAELVVLRLPPPDGFSLFGLAVITLGLIAYCFRLTSNEGKE